MGCSCGKKKRGSSRIGVAGNRPTIGPRPAPVQGLAATRTPSQVQAQAREQVKNQGGLSKQRRQIEQKRRALIARRKFNK